MDVKDLRNWEDVNKLSKTTNRIEDAVLKETNRIYDENPNIAIPTKYFKDNQKDIFGDVSSNRQPRLNKAMHNLANSNQVELIKRAGKNYIRYIPKAIRASKTK